MAASSVLGCNCPQPCTGDCCGPADCPRACDATTCSTGCCDSFGVCEDGTLDAACGSGGAACVACASGTACVNEACVMSAVIDAGVPPACPAPTDGGVAYLSFDAGERVSSLALTWGTSGAALALLHSGSAGSLATLQQLSSRGDLLASTDLGPAFASGAISVATDGAGWVACWDGPDGGEVSCASVPLDAGIVAGGAQLQGAGPSVAFGPEGYVVAFSASGSGIEVQPLANDATASGSPTFETGSGDGTCSVSATAEGYALATSQPGFNEDTLAFFVPNFSSPEGDLGVPGTGAPLRAASSGEEAAVVWVDASTGQVNAAVGAPGSGTQTLAGPLRLGADTSLGRAAVAGAAQSFAATWSAFGAVAVQYQAFDLDAGALGPAVTLDAAQWDDVPNALVAVPDGFLAAYGLGIDGTPVVVRHLVCP